MASESELPTWGEIEAQARFHLHTARTEMSEVRDWLNPDWRLTAAQAGARSEVLRIVGEVKRLIDQAKDALHA